MKTKFKAREHKKQERSDGKREEETDEKEKRSEKGGTPRKEVEV